MAKIQISIVTIEKDNLSGLTRTMLSVANQVFDSDLNVQHLICQSSKGLATAPIGELGLEHISRVVSTEDSGIYNAMNRGLAAAEPGWILFLNSGDELVGINALQKVSEVLRVSKSPVVQFRTCYSDGTIHPFSRYGFWSLYFGREMHVHPSLLLNSKYFPSLCYDEKFRIAGDYKFVLKALLDVKLEHSDEVIAFFEGGGISSTDIPNVIAEMNRVRLELKPTYVPRLLVLSWNLYVSCRIQRIMSRRQK